MGSNYIENLLEKIKQYPLYKERQEFGQMLFRQKELFTESELKRYNELKEILKQETHERTTKTESGTDIPK